MPVFQTLASINFSQIQFLLIVLTIATETSKAALSPWYYCLRLQCRQLLWLTKQVAGKFIFSPYCRTNAALLFLDLDGQLQLGIMQFLDRYEFISLMARGIEDARCWEIVQFPTLFLYWFWHWLWDNKEYHRAPHTLILSRVTWKIVLTQQMWSHPIHRTVLLLLWLEMLAVICSALVAVNQNPVKSPNYCYY